MPVMKVNWQCRCCNEVYIMKLVWFSVVLLDTISLQPKLSADVLHLKWLLYDGFDDQCSFHSCHMVTAFQSSLSKVLGKHKNHRPSSVHMTFSLRQQHKKNTAHTWHESFSQPLQMTLQPSFHFRIFIIFLHWTCSWQVNAHRCLHCSDGLRGQVPSELCQGEKVILTAPYT